MKQKSIHYFKKAQVIIMVFILSNVLSFCKSEIANSALSSSKETEAAKSYTSDIKDIDATLLQQFTEKYKQLGTNYQPRTKHLRPDKTAKYTNRLFLESSPYLLQHAHNPVNWYSWSDEAFETAKKLNRPILLSIGYSTCHWCHVMEEESFEDEEIAHFMNENFIAIKVDREERPDIDAIYMNAVQVMTGGGGWPMTVFLTSDRKPFFGGTYFPARDGDRGTRTGFFTILKKLAKVYHEEPEKISSSSDKLANIISENLASVQKGENLPNAQLFQTVVQYCKDSFDSRNGGLNRAPKFPSSMPLRLLFRHFHNTQDQSVLSIATLTLDKMAAGGIYDHVAGGFHRYSTDSIWLVPHFEKMLYDNALLAITYLEAYQVTKNSEYSRIVNEILHYIEKEMTDTDGGFYSATDADSLTPTGHREEGYFFTWSLNELKSMLGQDFSIFQQLFVINEQGDLDGRIILHRRNSIVQAAKNLEMEPKQVESFFESAKELLYKARNKRPFPLRDEKIITSWNALMISAFARAGLILNNSHYVEVASKAANFLINTLYDNKRLYRTYKDGKARHLGYLDDYAFFTAALLDLFEANHDTHWFQKATELDEILKNQFEDQNHGGFFMTSHEHEKLLAREKPNYDGAEPAGNSIALLNLYRLAKFTSNDTYRKRADKALLAFSQSLESHPMGLTEMMLALDFRLYKAKEIIIVIPNDQKENAEPFLKIFRENFLPNRVFSIISDESIKEQSELIPIMKGKIAVNGKTTAYICENGVCKLPALEVSVFAKQILE